jgi:hypothetical protein
LGSHFNKTAVAGRLFRRMPGRVHIGQRLWLGVSTLVNAARLPAGRLRAEADSG